ncbi:MAG TPA: hypothetical protein VLT62_22835 [Candidatus Methylomirabilis sp.]|nr:hypothetical protein [Candidatus Methylomirabilis sp.]
METPNQSRPAMPAAPHPACNAMLICDQALVEGATGKTSLVGIFENISAHQYPARCGLVTVYAKLTDAQGEYRIRLELISLADFTVIGQGQIRATIGDRMVPAELVFQIAGLAFEKPGRYEFRLYANDRWVGSKSLRLVQAAEPTPQPEQIRVFGSTVSVRWLNFMLPAAKPIVEQP